MKIFRKYLITIEKGNNEAQNIRIKMYQDDKNAIAKKMDIFIKFWSKLIILLITIRIFL